MAECSREKKECVHPRYLALNERSDMVRCQGMVLRYSVLWRAGSDRYMLKDGAQLEKFFFFFVSVLYLCFRTTLLKTLCFRTTLLKTLYGLSLRYCFTVNFSTIHVG